MRIQTLLVLFILALIAVNTYAEDVKPAETPATPVEGENAAEDDDLIDEELEEDIDFNIAPPQLTEAEIKELTSWEGHMKPLGSVNEKIAVKEVSEFPTPKEFYLQNVIKSEPLIIRGGASKQTAFSKWTDDYLKASDKADKLRVYVENGRKEDRSKSSIELPNLPFFADYLNSYASADQFMISDVVPALKPDYELPSALQCPLLKKSFMRALMHLNGGNTKSVLHHEHYEDIHCVLAGNKNYLLANPASNHEHIFIDADDAEAGEYVAVDVDAVDAVKYPGIRKVIFYNADLKAGDCIYIPSTWMYADKTSDGRQLAMSVWWARDDDVDEKIAAGGCIAEGDWTVDKLSLNDEVATLMITDDERKVIQDAIDARSAEEEDLELDEVDAAAAPVKDEL